jgi:hypothetical protein
LRTIANVTNPGLAINVQGVAAMLYQRLVTVAANNRWSTVLERSTNRFATVTTTSELANTPPGVGFGAAGDLGDFASLIAHGKDFYGAFCAVNAPLNANFPSGVNFLRNADFTTGNLRNVANTANVATSVDPFFVHWQTVEPKDDVYVRDWTDSAAVADDGAEPSLRPAFYVTPDVWNRRGTDAGPFVNDQPSNENAGNGVDIVGNNWAFARIRRKAPAPAGAPDLAVTAHFLVSPLGTGSNYADASSMDPDLTFPDPDPVVTFAAADVGPTTTTPFPWHLNPVASTHLCLAVEISTPSDPFVGASLRGRAPGWPSTDLEIVDDNNKAQRNMGLSTTPARESAGESVLWAIVHNAATFRRDVELQIRWPIPRSAGGRPSAVLISPGLEPMPIREAGRVVLARMQPLENRWVGIRMRGLTGRPGLVAAVEFDELVGDAAVNGFALGVRLGSDRDVEAHARERLRSVLTRLVHGWKADLQDALAQTEKRLVFPYAVEVAKAVTAALPPARAKSQFGIEERYAAFRRVAKQASSARYVELTSLLECIDAHLTSLQLARGNRADILQTVRWMLAAAEYGSKDSADARARIATACERFVERWEAGRAHGHDAVDLLRAASDPISSLGTKAEQTKLRELLEGCLSAREDLDAFQGRYARLVKAMVGVH